MSATENGGLVNTYSPEGQPLVSLSAAMNGNGVVVTYTKSGREKILD